MHPCQVGTSCYRIHPSVKIFNMITKIINPLLALFIAICIIFPSADFFSINIKMILAFLLSIFTIILLYKTRFKIIYVIFPVFLFLYILFYCFISCYHEIPFEDIKSQSIAFLGPFFSIYFPLFFISKKIISVESVLKIIISSFVFSCMIKIILETIMIYYFTIDQSQILIQNIFGVNFISLDAGLFYRIHFSSDYLIPVLLYTIIKKKDFGIKIPTKKTAVIIILFIISAVLSYSRYLWFYSIIAIVLAVTTSHSFKFNTALIVTSALIVVPLILTPKNPLAEFIATRYSGEYASNSDGPRKKMRTALTKTFNQHIFLGHGLGASPAGFTRIKKLPWYFELQWLAFAMQFGCFGLTILIGLACTILLSIIKQPIKWTTFGLACLYSMWLLLGLFNGFMLTSVGGIIFLTFILAPRCFKQVSVKHAPRISSGSYGKQNHPRSIQTKLGYSYE